MKGKIHSEQEALTWHQVYQDYRVSSASISKQFGIKHETMLATFRRYGLKLRPSGFRPNNCRGKDGIDSIRLRMLWLFKFAYKRRAARKNLQITISEDEFIALVTSDCHYCGKSWKKEVRTVNRREVRMLTIDRKDSSKGYVSENCVSCCKRCNTIKMDMSYEEFLSQIKDIAQNLKLV